MRIEFFAFIVEVILAVAAVYNPLGKQVSLTKQTNKEITKPWISNRPPRTRTPDGLTWWKDSEGGWNLFNWWTKSISDGLLDTLNFRTLVTEVWTNIQNRIIGTGWIVSSHGKKIISPKWIGEIKSWKITGYFETREKLQSRAWRHG